ncbi:MAG: 4-hydroxy-tetrahydrodipicolinate synthase [Chromatiales bacterium]|uniref:4-hydroxy-tetrahydrodipicolinate synthase n=1 Tax=endosymbiont of Lamellibrachia barhami TaxID=205975 RepID=UPI0015B1ACD8|nr:4-hydroxy-tetrahydrodipicolinate synthase [endosymbiont of Lamellibrachia barhami]MBA1445189.1 4-hydroxy-tetrahydrodipicolinate synthase [Gammaproteobacteria bacterium]
MFRGSMVAMVTPMKEGGSLDDEALYRLVDFHVEMGTDAIIVMGTTGESATLDETEHCGVIRKVVEYAAGRIPVIAGTGANSTTEAISLTRCAMEAGADACLLVTPYYNKPTQEGLYLHHKAVAEAVDIPQILYNVPGRTACDMLPETVARLAEVENIIGVKEASGDLQRVTRIRELCGPDFAIYSGDDATGCESMLIGGDGVISVTSNVAPKLMRQMCEAALAGEREAAERLDAEVAALHAALFVESNPIPVKWAVVEMGLASKGIRLPLTWLSEVHQPKVRAAMEQAGVC